MKVLGRLYGFTLIELILVMSIFMTLTAFATPSLLGGRSQVDINTTMSTVIADIKNQQLKSMIGDTEGRAESDSYGVHFETNSYTLFHGSNYVEGDPSNAVIPLEGSTQFGTVSFPGRQVVFVRGSGEILGFVAGADSVSLFNPSNNQTRVIVLNQYGVVTGSQ